MHFRFVASSLAALLLSCQVAFADAAPVPAASAPAARPVCSDGSAGGSSISFDDAFAHPIDDAAALRFISLLANMDGARQRAVLAKIRSDRTNVPANGDLDAGCLTETSYRTLRAATLISINWNIDSGDEIFQKLVDRLALAFTALDRNEALALFGTTAAELAGGSSQVGICDTPDRDARAIHAVEPTYPPIARAYRTTGDVVVRVALDNFGLVRSVTLLRSTAGSGSGAEALTQSAIAAAASSTYAPKIVQCKGVAGAYAFIVTFSGR